MARWSSPPSRRGAAGSGVIFRAGEGVGTVTRRACRCRPASRRSIPVPRAMIARGHRRGRGGDTATAGDVEVEIAIPGGEALAGQDAERPARHRRRPVDPRHHRHRRAVFLRGLDRLDPSAASTSPAPPASTHVAGATGAHLRGGGAAAARPARDRADRHGRFRRRHAEISAHATRSRASPSPAASPR